jgi:hypothetical protein
MPVATSSALEETQQALLGSAFFWEKEELMFCRNDLVALGLGSPHWVYKLACHFLQMNLFSCVNCCSEKKLHSKNSSKLLNVASNLGSEVQNLETKTSHTTENKQQKQKKKILTAHTFNRKSF